jgi:hypothetical protein
LFSFKGTATGPTTFECNLDGSEFVECTSSCTYTMLSAGEHTFSVRAVDNVGNRRVSPTTFTWTIEEAIDPVIAIGNLIADIRSLDSVNFVKLVLCC